MLAAEALEVSLFHAFKLPGFVKKNIQIHLYLPRRDENTE